MRRSRSTRLVPLLLIAFLIGAVVALPVAKAASQAETLSEEELAEEAVLAEEAGETDADAPEAAEQQEEEPVDEKDVLVLTDANFDDTIKKHSPVLVSYT